MTREELDAIKERFTHNQFLGHDLCALVAAAEDALRYREALEFYARPSTYFAIGFLPDPPCGQFMDDFSVPEAEWVEEYDPRPEAVRPGGRARAALAPKDALVSRHDSRVVADVERAFDNAENLLSDEEENRG